MDNNTNKNKPVKPNFQNQQTTPVKPSLGNQNVKPAPKTLVKDDKDEVVKQIEAELNGEATTKNTDNTSKKLNKKQTKNDNKNDDKAAKNNVKLSKKTIGIIAGSLVAVVLLIVIAGKALSSNNKHITIADNASTNTPNTQAQPGNITTLPDTSETRPVVTEVKEEKYTETPASEVSKPGDKIVIPVTVNTKLKTDEQYTDHYSFLTFKVNDVAVGYDNVISSIKEFNQSGNKIINIKDKDAFYLDNEDSTLAMFSVDMAVPDNFPTQDTKTNKIFVEPTVIISLEGTEDTESITTMKYVYAVPDLTDISCGNDELVKGNTYTYKFVGTVPNDINSDNYNIKITLGCDNETYEYIIKGLDIKDNALNETEVTIEDASTDSTEMTTEASTEQTTEEATDK